jgi:hypothetical protein
VNNSTLARAEDPDAFTVVFYGSKTFCCKPAQFCAMRCKPHSLGLPMIRNTVQRSENPRKNSLLNYESPALTAELQAHLPMKTGRSYARDTITLPNFSQNSIV